MAKALVSHSHSVATAAWRRSGPTLLRRAEHMVEKCMVILLTAVIVSRADSYFFNVSLASPSEIRVLDFRYTDVSIWKNHLHHVDSALTCLPDTCYWTFIDSILDSTLSVLYDWYWSYAWSVSYSLFDSQNRPFQVSVGTYDLANSIERPDSVWGDMTTQPGLGKTLIFRAKHHRNSDLRLDAFGLEGASGTTTIRYDTNFQAFQGPATVVNPGPPASIGVDSVIKALDGSWTVLRNTSEGDINNSVPAIYAYTGETIEFANDTCWRHNGVSVAIAANCRLDSTSHGSSDASAVLPLVREDTAWARFSLYLISPDVLVARYYRYSYPYGTLYHYLLIGEEAPISTVQSAPHDTRHPRNRPGMVHTRSVVAVYDLLGRLAVQSSSMPRRQGVASGMGVYLHAVGATARKRLDVR